MIDLSQGVLVLPQWDLEDDGAPSCYGAPGGQVALREALGQRLGVPPSHLAITTGASLALSAALASLERPGSILCPIPHYPVYPRLAALFGLELRWYGLQRRRGWLPDPEELAGRIGANTRAIMWNFPGNPVGGLPDRRLCARVATLIEQHGTSLICDETYARFVYGGRTPPDPADRFPADRLIRVGSFSKLLDMPGERLGYVVADPARLLRIVHAHWTLGLSPPLPAQHRALEALNGSFERRLARVLETLESSRDAMVECLRTVPGLEVESPPAGIFLWLDCSAAGMDAEELAAACRREAGVAVATGTAFGVASPPYLRVSFAVLPEVAELAGRRLASFLGDRVAHHRQTK